LTSVQGPIFAREVEVVIEGRAFLEGPRWHDDCLYVSDFFGPEVLAVSSDGDVEVLCEVPAQPSGLGFDPQGRLLIVSMLDRRLLRLEAGQISEVCDFSDLMQYTANDMVVDRQGRAYIGGFGWEYGVDPVIHSTALVRIDPDGTSAVAANDLVFPNGAVITPDGRTLIISETFAGRITAFDVAEDGSLSNRRVWADLAHGSRWHTVPDAAASGRPLPDGLALDQEGAVWMGHAAGNGALRVAEGGEILEFIPTGELAVYAAALGGPDRRTLYMCASPPLLQSDPSIDHRGSLLSCRVDVAAI
jgi:sugar lactone lactonase YvrE